MAADDGTEDEEKTKLLGRKLTASQVKDLLEMLNAYQDILSDKPGTMVGVKHIRSLPYRLCPMWREQVRSELKKLLSDGIREHSSSPWSSPIVPVKKPDYTVRICIDFRKVNAVTQPDPYCMPLMEELGSGGKQIPIQIRLDKGILSNSPGRSRQK